MFYSQCLGIWWNLVPSWTCFVFLCESDLRFSNMWETLRCIRWKIHHVVMKPCLPTWHLTWTPPCEKKNSTKQSRFCLLFLGLRLDQEFHSDPQGSSFGLIFCDWRGSFKHLNSRFTARINQPGFLHRHLRFSLLTVIVWHEARVPRRPKLW